jgi:hypothetical protein
VDSNKGSLFYLYLCLKKQKETNKSKRKEIQLDNLAPFGGASLKLKLLKSKRYLQIICHRFCEAVWAL